VILLDTNVLSEFMRPVSAAHVVAWLDAQVSDQVWVSAITRAEIELGIALMPDGQRKHGLKLAADAIFTEEFTGRCLLPFDERAASEYARIVATRTRLGRPISVEDAQIAAIAMARGMTLATRNGKDFAHIAGLDLIDPWQLAS
jgi:predicted nucleic acid-binding protein